MNWIEFQKGLAAFLATDVLNPVIRKVNDLNTNKLDKTAQAVDSAKLEGQDLKTVLATALSEAETSLRDGVKPEGDTLRKLYDLLSNVQTNVDSNKSTGDNVDAGLQTQIDSINAVIASDDFNLDTVQELVTAIKDLQASDANFMSQYVRLASDTKQEITSDLDVKGVSKDFTISQFSGPNNYAVDSTKDFIVGQSYVFLTKDSTPVTAKVIAVDPGNQSPPNITVDNSTDVFTAYRSSTEAKLYENGKRVATKDWVEQSQASQNDLLVTKANKTDLESAKSDIQIQIDSLSKASKDFVLDSVYQTDKANFETEQVKQNQDITQLKTDINNISYSFDEFVTEVNSRLVALED